MKKVLTICAALVMVLVMSLPVFAAPGNFVSSPSGLDAPEFIEMEGVSEGCVATLKMTSYANRHTLDAASRAKLEEAYDDIANGEGVSKLNADLAAYAASLGVDLEKLAASDLFDISAVNCADHEDHDDGFRITIRRANLKNFVGVLHLGKNGWEFLDATAKGGNITFTVKDLSPFAIIVDTSADSPVTGDFSRIGVYAAIVAVSASALIFIGVALKKRKTH